DERGHLAGARAADVDAPLEAGIAPRVGLGVRDVEHVVRVDEHAAGPAELRPARDVVAVLVEDLDAVVGTVCDEQPALRVHGEAVRVAELAGAFAGLAPLLQELPVLRSE